MSAEELVAFWGYERMASIATATRAGAVHAAPLDVRLIDGKFYVATFPDSRRLVDHRENAHCVLTAWDDAYHAAIVYGDALVVDVEPRSRAVLVAGEQGYDPTSMTTVVVSPTRIYAIRPPAGTRRGTGPTM